MSTIKESDYKGCITSVHILGWNGNPCVNLDPSLLFVTPFPLPLLKWLSESNRTLDVSPSLLNSSAKIKLLLLRYCFGFLMAHKRLHWKFLIWYWQMEILWVVWCEPPLQFTHIRLQAALRLYWLGLRVFRSDQPCTGLLQSCCCCTQ